MEIKEKEYKYPCGHTITYYFHPPIKCIVCAHIELKRRKGIEDGCAK